MLPQLTTPELYKYLTRDKCTRTSFIGIFARDQLKLKFNYPCCFICNTQSQYEQGEHWLAFYYDEKGHCIFFDSYGQSPECYMLENYIKKTSTSYSFNKKQIQTLFSDSCGYYCLVFLFFKCRNVDLEKINFNEIYLNLCFE
jgi:hypothetical protein